MDNPTGTETLLSLTARIEALLFVAPSAVSAIQIATALDLPLQEIEVGLRELEENYRQHSYVRGLRLQRHQGKYQLTTASEAAPVIERFLGLESSSRLSRAALETLAIIAYHEMATRPQIDAIRGVNSDGVLKSLLSKGLIQEIGRADAPGRPFLYSITTDFLQSFGLNSLSDLPPLVQEDNRDPQAALE